MILIVWKMNFIYLLLCPLYDIFFCKINLFFRTPSMFKLVQLLNSESVKNMNNHGKYIKNSLNLRNEMLP